MLTMKQIPDSVRAHEAMDNLTLGPVPTVLEHKLLSPGLPLGRTVLHLPFSTGAWQKLNGREKTDGEREGKVSLVSLYLLFSEEEAFYSWQLSAWKLICWPCWRVRMSFIFQIYIPLYTPHVSISFRLFLLAPWSSFFTPPLSLSHHQAYCPFSLVNTLFPLAYCNLVNTFQVMPFSPQLPITFWKLRRLPSLPCQGIKHKTKLQSNFLSVNSLRPIKPTFSTLFYFPWGDFRYAINLIQLKFDHLLSSFASMEQIVINVYIIIILQLFQMRSFSYLYIYTHIQASFLFKRLYGFVLRYTTIILVIVKPVLHCLDSQCLLIHKLHKIIVLLVSVR